MIALFWIFFGLGIACFIATMITTCIRKTRQKMIHLWLNVGTALCSVVCSTINILVN